jgi:hypothetical protein
MCVKAKRVSQRLVSAACVLRMSSSHGKGQRRMVTEPIKLPKVDRIAVRERQCQYPF